MVAWPLQLDPAGTRPTWPYGGLMVEVCPHPLHPLSDPGRIHHSPSLPYRSSGTAWTRRRHRYCDVDPDDGLSSPLLVAHPGTPPLRSATDLDAPPPHTHVGLDPSLAVVVQMRATVGSTEPERCRRGSSGPRWATRLAELFLISKIIYGGGCSTVPVLVNLLTEAVGQPSRSRPRLTVTFDPRRLACPPRLSVFARLDQKYCSSVARM